MEFGGFNALAVALAALAAFVFGGLYYGLLVSKAWMRAARVSEAQAQMTPGLIITTLVCEVLIAAGIAGVLGHLGVGQVTPWNGIVTGFFLAVTLVIPATAMNARYQRFGWDLVMIDSIHWLGVGIIAGGVVGWMGV
ncbi:MAG: DUF1761 domain-containing protein [Rhizobiaceae bacterium]|jgi:hypothetical protein|nr:DUF1761 domain-containing protein [Rhizobiaceae bacterium]